MESNHTIYTKWFTNMSNNEYPFKEWIWPKSSCVCLVKVRALLQTFTTAASRFPWRDIPTTESVQPNNLSVSKTHALFSVFSYWRNDSTVCIGRTRIDAVLQTFRLHFRFTWKTAQQTQIQWCVSLSDFEHDFTHTSQDQKRLRRSFSKTL